MNHLIAHDMPLLEALKSCFPDSSRRTLELWIRNGRIWIDGAPATSPRQPVKKGEAIHLEKKERLIPGDIKIVYQDLWMTLIDKPAGLLSVPNPSGEWNALEILKTHYRKRHFYAVHRLDQRTSGILLFAKRPESEKKFRRLFDTHSLERYYLAIVHGRLTGSGTWEHYLREQEDFSVTLSTPLEGKKAITHYTVLKNSKEFSYLVCRLETGRKHQIRVHCLAAGHPVIGDERYGDQKGPIGRLGLHAYALGFVHPFTNQKMRFISGLPYLFKKVGFPELYPFNFKNWNFGCAKAPGLNDHKGPNISNMGSFMII